MATDDEPRIHFEGKTYPLAEFEVGELEWLEEYVGATIDDARALGSMKAAVGFVYLIKRRSDDKFTLEDARKVKFAAFDAADEPVDNGAAPSKPQRRPTKPAAA